MQIVGDVQHTLFAQVSFGRRLSRFGPDQRRARRNAMCRGDVCECETEGRQQRPECARSPAEREGLTEPPCSFSSVASFCLFKALMWSRNCNRCICPSARGDIKKKKKKPSVFNQSICCCRRVAMFKFVPLRDVGLYGLPSDA